MNRLIILISFIALILTSCDVKDEYKVEKSKVVEASGEWFVTYSDASGDVGGGYSSLVTYNTSDDNGLEIWVSDQGNFWTYQVKIPVDVNNLTFGSATPLPNNSYECEVIIRNGKIMKGVSLQPSGAMADSIYFELLFSDDATPYETTYIVSGNRRTGFLEDEP